ncbi:MAG: ECF transporter S component [Clostridiales bacterium]|nr:ECF transporter S component [Clostridiales bacterium]
MEEINTEAVSEEQEQSAEVFASSAEAAPVDAAASEAAATEHAAAPSKNRITQYFSARRIAYIAVFTALSFVVRIFDFPILPALDILKFDFSDLFVLLCGYSLGPAAGVICGVLKEVLSIALGTTSGIGELANILVLIPFVLLPSLMYKKHKGIKSVILWLGIACVIRVAWSVPVNYFISFPAFMVVYGGTWTGGMNFFLNVWYWAVLFNLIKALILAASVLLLYKSVSRLINMINKKFDDRKAAKNNPRPS